MCYGGALNVTIDDTSSLIVYTPASSWHASSVPCSDCLSPNPQDAYKGTWHDGTHIIPTVDADDLPPSRDTNGGKDSDDSDHIGEDKDKDTDKDADDGRRKKRWRSKSGAFRRQDPSDDTADNPFFTTHFDDDDGGFVDKPVLAQFNFTGAIALG
ncbi:hypothetical protein BN946_scf184788.g3 [Trametes cinnabarina]|uniref:Uncharacterized protein n=1 Tax=Pycnoporus cinnabarinus TaxID=5643 RepID=A0A060S133_PYCCI|nr:hypothetical protein BN946_scf184788.g3 [Trametes cinnabarina]